MERFVLQPSIEKGYWVLTDTVNGIVCKFKEKEFNSGQSVTFLNDTEKPDVLLVARIMHDMGEWLANNHYNIATP